ncbi:hypothetical protein CTAYLR_005187 [Chrysophaeum taylorii]|uniref:Uncharacterized protein n=1 Tax=Chrysophaeum taylorii TaxID=2483200 RepID=A0AAD7UPN7_9STRA|nr:hypothetical protein CTAYLR_005170 [Chrysophaeum taylorii]KAJ8614158.1 hypothetical protein CTAYLR_005187 [Chrysophaeum taylorii]
MAVVAVIVGAGSKWDEDGNAKHLEPSVRFGLGGALSLRFARDYHVVLMGRRTAVLEEVAAEVRKIGGEATVVSVDVTSDESVDAAFDVAKSVGFVEVLVFNCGPPMPKGVTFATLPLPGDLDPAYLKMAYDVGLVGAARCVKRVVGPMLEAGNGNIIFSGATMSLRGGAKFSAMSPTKFALRSYAQSCFQAYAPKGIHVSHVVVDGVIDSPATRSFNNVQHQNPADLAEAYFHLTKQPKTTWTHELQLSPNQSGIGMRL